HLDASVVYDYVHFEALSSHIAELVEESAPVSTLKESSSEKLMPAVPVRIKIDGSAAGRLSGESRRGIRLSVASPDETTIGPSARAETEIAIIGIACRVPGAANADEFWRNLAAGRDCITEVPAERWDIDSVFDPDPNVEGKTYCRSGGFIDDVDKFDPLFFNLSHAEAEVMDPQQRIFLEESWKAFENAGYAAKSLSEVKCGVFVGATVGDYSALLRRENPIVSQSAFAGTGLTPAILAAP